MTLVFLTNLVNHHQIPIADELYSLLGRNYIYVAFERVPDELLKGGYKEEIQRPYIIKAYESIPHQIQKIVDDADVVIIGSASEKWVQNRLKRNKITFHYSERWFKKITYKIFSPKLWISIYKHHYKFRNSRSYMLCASAFTAKDANNVLCYKNKCFKWGYFTKVEDMDIEGIILKKRAKEIKIMWCARFLNWKHPELVVKLAAILKKDKINAKIDMFGSGIELANTIEFAKKTNVEDIVSFKGNLPNDEILKQYQDYHIFIFTSDRNEGWGAVLNEAMSNGCAVIASDKIGSAPYLINDGENGLVFKSGSIRSLSKKVEFLVQNEEARENMSRNAYKTMREMWSPQIAAHRLFSLSESLLNDRIVQTFSTGPCSKA